MVDFYLRLRPFVSFFSSNKSDFVASLNLIFNSQIFPRFYLKSLETFFFLPEIVIFRRLPMSNANVWSHMGPPELHWSPLWQDVPFYLFSAQLCTIVSPPVQNTLLSIRFSVVCRQTLRAAQDWVLFFFIQAVHGLIYVYTYYIVFTRLS